MYAFGVPVWNYTIKPDKNVAFFEKIWLTAAPSRAIIITPMQVLFFARSKGSCPSRRRGPLQREAMGLHPPSAKRRGWTGRKSAAGGRSPAPQDANLLRRCRYARSSNARLHRVQAKELQHDEEQKERSRPSGDEQVLPFLQKAYCPSRDEVSRKERMQLHGR